MCVFLFLTQLHLVKDYWKITHRQRKYEIFLFLDHDTSDYGINSKFSEVIGSFKKQN